MSESDDTMVGAAGDWYCVQTRPKSEHIAAAGLRRFRGVEPYCPRIRFQRPTRRGKVWFCEALFPNYLFAKFRPEDSLRAVQSCPGVVRVVSFGELPLPVPEEVLDGVRAEMGDGLIKEVEIPVSEGEEVEVACGPLAGMTGIVTGLMRGENRVQILMGILGQGNRVDVSAGILRSTRRHPLQMVG